MLMQPSRGHVHLAQRQSWNYANPAPSHNLSAGKAASGHRKASAIPERDGLLDAIEPSIWEHCREVIIFGMGSLADTQALVQDQGSMAFTIRNVDGLQSDHSLLRLDQYA